MADKKNPIIKTAIVGLHPYSYYLLQHQDAIPQAEYSLLLLKEDTLFQGQQEIPVPDDIPLIKD